MIPPGGLKKGETRAHDIRRIEIAIVATIAVGRRAKRFEIWWLFGFQPFADGDSHVFMVRSSFGGNHV